MADLGDFEQSYRGRRVLVTGHTGFTGGWLVSWLQQIDAEVCGLSLAPATTPSLFETLELGARMTSVIGDIRDLDMVGEVFRAFQPEIVLHLAAQAIVGIGYSDPVGTFTTNAVGTLHVLDAARRCDATRALVCVTTDKVYLNRGWYWGYREVDELGAKDPYGASKACAELIAVSYQRSFAQGDGAPPVATARGGNIIGGGDWADGRIVPDFARALAGQASLQIRNPSYIRPWQHVLALVHGYLLLGHALVAEPERAVGGWNFGPHEAAVHSVQHLVDRLAANWRAPEIIHGDGSFAEERYLQLDSTKARVELGWRPAWTFEETVARTAAWYRDVQERPERAAEVTAEQIGTYRQALGI